MVCGIDLTL